MAVPAGQKPLALGCMGWPSHGVMQLAGPLGGPLWGRWASPRRGKGHIVQGTLVPISYSVPCTLRGVCSQSELDWWRRVERCVSRDSAWRERERRPVAKACFYRLETGRERVYPDPLATILLWPLVRGG